MITWDFSLSSYVRLVVLLVAAVFEVVVQVMIEKTAVITVWKLQSLYRCKGKLSFLIVYCGYFVVDQFFWIYPNLLILS